MTEQNGPDLKYTCTASKALYGVQVLEFTKNFTHPVDGNYTVTYYWQGKSLRAKACWSYNYVLINGSYFTFSVVKRFCFSDPEYEWGIDVDTGDGLSIPVAMVATGTKMIEGEEYDVKVIFDYHNFMGKMAPEEEFQPPSDIHCDGRNDGTKKSFQTPDNYAFTSEVVYYPEGQSDSVSVLVRQARTL